MTVLSAQSIREQVPLLPLLERTVHECGMTYGLSACGYDIRIKQGLTLHPGDFALASTVERFAIPNTMMGVLHDKSTLARLGLSVFNTVAEPGWEGYLTLELKNQGTKPIKLVEGQPIAQMVFRWLDRPTDLPYGGKYQSQPDYPVVARFE